MPRTRRPRSTAHAGLLLDAKERHGLSQVQVAELTRAYDADGEGVAQNTVHYAVNGAVRDPTIKTLYLLGRALGVPMRRQVEALGYDYEAADSAAPDTRRLQVQRMVSAMSDDELRRVERVLGLTEDERPRLDAWLDASEAGRSEAIKKRRGEG